MKTRAIILAGGEGTRLGVLTAKRTKPAVPYAGKYRIIDFPLSNCVNSRIFDVLIIAQYRPHSLIEHIGSGGPWDLNRDFTGGVRIYTPYKARQAGWFTGTADAVQQNFSFIKRGDPDLLLILSGDHVYTMDYEPMINYHLSTGADMTMGTIRVPMEEAPRFGIVTVDENQRVTGFVEKPENPPSNLANMGIYLFKREFLDSALWADHQNQNSTHDFGKDIIPTLIEKGMSVFAFPYDGYWVDVGTVHSYWQAHMDLLCEPPSLNLNNRNWVIHTRTEERPPMRICSNTVIENSMVADGCSIASGARIIRSVLSPGVSVGNNVTIQDSIILTDSIIGENSKIYRGILDKQVQIGTNCIIGSSDHPQISMVGKGSIFPDNYIIQSGGMIGPDVIMDDYSENIIKSTQTLQTRRSPHEL
ncbi:MAG TPA: glucose-1-phosphate adenylyltransferase [Leptolinea sp.]